jgi:hypothetical protein
MLKLTAKRKYAPTTSQTLLSHIVARYKSEATPMPKSASERLLTFESADYKTLQLN